MSMLSRRGSILDILSGCTDKGLNKEKEETLDKNVNSNKETLFNTAEEVIIFNNVLYELTKQSGSIRIQILVGRSRTVEGELLLNSMAVSFH